MRTLIVLFILLTGGLTLLGQDATPRPKFEVASVKRNDSLPSERSGAMRLTGDTLRIERISLKGLIQFAYEVKPYQLVGVPSWIDSAFYRIEAKAKEPIDRAEVRLMLRPLLAERFKLVT
jgi:uncharacterized protein (TIGR03435 family)